MNRSTHRRVANGLSWVGHILLATLLLSLLAGQVAAKDRITYFHNDALGSPVAATNDAGETLWHEDYAPYGARLLREDDGANALWYTGKQEEEALGLHYYGARWYDAEIGRFLSLDPAGFDEGNLQSFNKYAYANNNPYKFVDPDGRASLFANAFMRGLSSDAAMQAAGMGNSALAAGVGSALVGLSAISPGPEDLAVGGVLVGSIAKVGGIAKRGEAIEGAAAKRGLGNGRNTSRSFDTGGPTTSRPASFPQGNSQTQHIFRDAPGHLADTPANIAI
ncbi:RHS repeat-associated core domain-containing protein [Thiocystis violacea]|uniref:RHS repeat-associated core domain-containing protein n=1 Tax=Thiocystis violacea TaxID=13725 RepID=UPI0019030B47|nr:RHS repeat-associated core domain-containing protein [Thiocystis violacea]MBK1725139.1 hypothetical protein [Thiocystis violacea]